MKKLACCIALALSGQSIHAGELVFSPTLDYRLMKAKVESPQPELQRDTGVNALQLDADIEYTSKKLTSTLSGTLSNFQYTDSKESKATRDDLRWITALDLWRDDLSIYYGWHRYNELFNGVQGSFADEVFGIEKGYVNYNSSYGLDYRLPASTDMIGRLGLSHEKRTGKYNNDRERDNDMFQNGNRYTTDSLEFELAQNKGMRPIYWRMFGMAKEQETRGTQFNHHEILTNVRFRLHEEWHLSARGDYSYYENTEAWRYADGGQGIKSEVYGAGVSWVKEHNSSYLELFYNQDKSNEHYYFGGELRWRFADRWSIRAEKKRRFYGDSDILSFFYQGEENHVLLSYHDVIDFNHMIIANPYVEGVYVCDFGDEPPEEFVLDKEVCAIPSDGIYIVNPGETVLTNIEVDYPMVTRLTHTKFAKFKWDVLTSKWEHTFWLRAQDRLELTDGYHEKQEEGNFLGDWLLNSHSYLRATWRYRALEVLPNSLKTTDRLYSLGYHFKLNTKSEVSLSFQHLNKWTSGDTYNYDDNRIILNYTHHFGRKNKNKEDLFESRRGE